MQHIRVAWAGLLQKYLMYCELQPAGAQASREEWAVYVPRKPVKNRRLITTNIMCIFKCGYFCIGNAAEAHMQPIQKNRFYDLGQGMNKISNVIA